jgi:DNA-binding MarR family transcriptional regulator
MATWQPDISPVLSRIPRLHYLFKALGDHLHADVGVTASMRAVMASLAAKGARTVPDLARERAVSRQHVQEVVDQLLAAGLAEAAINPSHRRSPLIGLSDEGRQRLRLLKEREADILARTAPAVSQADLAATSRLFDLLERDLAARVAEMASEAPRPQASPRQIPDTPAPGLGAAVEPSDGGPR